MVGWFDPANGDFIGVLFKGKAGAFTLILGPLYPNLGTAVYIPESTKDFIPPSASYF